MIARVWRGYTTHENAEAYFELLTIQVIPGIAAMKLPGFREIEVLRRRLDNEAEFITMMWFDTIENVKAFTGEDYERSHVPPEARLLLKRFDARSQHYDLVYEHVQAPA